MRNWAIRNRVLFVALVPLTLIVLLLSVHFTYTRLGEIERSLSERGGAIARQLAPACEYGVVSGNSMILTGLSNAALHEQDVVAVLITDNQNRLLARVNSEGSPSIMPQDLEKVFRGPQQVSGIERIEYLGTHAFRAPIHQSLVLLPELTGSPEIQGRAGTKQIGWVTVVMSGESINKQQHRILAEGIGLALLGFIATALIALRMARGVVRPIQQLTQSVSRLGRGALEERATTGSGGELGQLEAGINAMAAALAKARKLEQDRSDDALFLERVRAQVTLASIGDGVVTTDAKGHVSYMNPVAEQFTGWTSEQACGRLLDEVFQIMDETTDKQIRYPLHYCLERGQVIRHDSHHLLIKMDGAKVEIQDSAAPIRDRDGSILGAVVVFRDVTEIQHMIRRMAFLASHDPLTGLLNRREFENRLHQAIESGINEDMHHALLYIDLDQFKIVNDTSGHIAGDELLKQLAHHLQKEIRASDVLARLGGDEFGVILENCTVEKALQIAELIRQAVADFRFAWQNRRFEIGASIGLVPISSISGNQNEVLAAADSACYVAKDHGRNRIHVYQPGDAALTQRHGEMQWVQRLRQGLESGAFDLYCQPIVPIDPARAQPGRFCEILVRIQGRDFISPAEFLPAAERYHLMPAIDRWVIHTALALLREYQLQEPDEEPMRFALNLSGQSLGDDSFLGFVTRQLQVSGLDPTRICFEITETAAIANLTRARHFIGSLKRLGCQFALDDFGSGLSSFGYLKNLQVDYLKIAGDFIRDLADDPVDFAMVDAINQIGHIMGLATVAESVESTAILEIVREIGVTYAQGRGVGSPQRMFEVLGLTETHWERVRASARAALSDESRQHA